MKTNKLIWIVAVLFVMLLIVLGLAMSSSNTSTTTTVQVSEPALPAANIEGDTAQDTIKTLLPRTRSRPC